MAKENKDVEKVKNKIPLYVTVYEEIFSMINRGEFKLGEKLPGENELAKMLNVSRGTLRQALLLLQEDNIIFNYQGKGNFITNNKFKINETAQKEVIIATACNIQEYSDIEAEVVFQLPTVKLQRALNIESSRMVAAFDIDFFINGERVCYMVAFLPYDNISEYNIDFKDKKSIAASLFEYVEKNVVDIRTKLTVIEVEKEHRKKFDSEHTKSLAVFDEIVYSDLGMPIATMKTYCVPKYYEFYIKRK